MKIPQSCTLCPRACGANRTAQPGLCGGGPAMRIARAAPHHWEEPCISGTAGSGAVFFSGCPLGCVFCQNHAISRGAAGKTHTPPQAAALFLALQAKGVHNLNLVTAGHYRPWVLQALDIAKAGGLHLPVVWNTGGYESTQAVKALAGTVDVWLFDLKFCAPQLSAQLAGAPDYFTVATAALKAALDQAGPPVFDSAGLLVRGAIVRLLVLPGHWRDAVAILHFLAEQLPRGSFLLSLMSQYTPPEGAQLPAPLHRRLASYEYAKVQNAALALGLDAGYIQQRSSASVAYLPPFDMADSPG